MAVLLFPWPGLAHLFATAFAGVANAVAGFAFGEASRIEFIPPHDGAEQPWWVQLAVTNVFTGESYALPVDTRTVAYLRIAVFVSLAVAWPITKTRRGLKVFAAGWGLLFAVMALTVAMPLFQILGKVNVLPLGVAVQSLLSVGILSLVTYPSMAFAIPSLIFFAMAKVAAGAEAK